MFALKMKSAMSHSPYLGAKKRSCRTDTGITTYVTMYTVELRCSLSNSLSAKRQQIHPTETALPNNSSHCGRKQASNNEPRRDRQAASGAVRPRLRLHGISMLSQRIAGNG